MSIGVKSRPSSAGTESRVAAGLRPKRRTSLLLGGLLLAVVCAVVFTLIQLGGQSTRTALVVARPVAAGQVIAAADLRSAPVGVDSSVRVIPAGESARVVGRTAAVPLAEGALLTEAQLGPQAWPPAGKAVFAVAVKAGRLPSGIAAGNRVMVVTVAKDTTAGGQGGASSPVAATVVSVTEGIDSAGTCVVSLLLSQADAVMLAGSASELAVVLVAGS